MCTVWPSHSKWLSEYSNESASNFVLNLNIPPRRLFGWFRRCSYGQPVIGSFITTTCPLMHHVSFRVFWQNINSPRSLSRRLNPNLEPCDFWLFPKLKSPLKGKRFQTVDAIQENTTGQLMAIRTLWGPKVPTLKETEASLAHGQCFLYLVSSSINIFIFHITWLDTFWTGLRYLCLIFDTVCL